MPHPILKLIEIASETLLGKRREIELAAAAWCAGGHILIEDIPGVGKTTLALLLAKLAGFEISRIQFTSDLIPADILGVSIYHNDKKEFEFKKGPIFSSVVLADELNRASPKTQSAFMQVMEEGAVTIDGIHYDLPDPFLFIATQNPFEQAGTYQLPEGQLDRFMISLSLGFPGKEEEMKLLRGFNPRLKIQNLQKVITPEELKAAQEKTESVLVSETAAEYISRLLENSRKNIHCLPLSPRAGISAARMAKALAFLRGRNYVIIEDIQNVWESAAAHRLKFSRQEGVSASRLLLSQTEIPV